MYSLKISIIDRTQQIINNNNMGGCCSKHAKTDRKDAETQTSGSQRSNSTSWPSSRDLSNFSWGSFGSPQRDSIFEKSHIAEIEAAVGHRRTDDRGRIVDCDGVSLHSEASSR